MDWARRMQRTKEYDCETLRLYGSNLKVISSGNYTENLITNIWWQGGVGCAAPSRSRKIGGNKYFKFIEIIFCA